MQPYIIYILTSLLSLMQLARRREQGEGDVRSAGISQDVRILDTLIGRMLGVATGIAARSSVGYP